MQNDLMLVMGIIFLVLAIPSILSAFTDNRAPRIAAILIMVASGLIGLAVANKPGGYAWSDVPQAFVRVVSRLAN